MTMDDDDVYTWHRAIRSEIFEWTEKPQSDELSTSQKQLRPCQGSSAAFQKSGTSSLLQQAKLHQHNQRAEGYLLLHLNDSSSPTSSATTTTVPFLVMSVDRSVTTTLQGRNLPRTYQLHGWLTMVTDVQVGSKPGNVN